MLNNIEEVLQKIDQIDQSLYVRSDNKMFISRLSEVPGAELYTATISAEIAENIKAQYVQKYSPFKEDFNLVYKIIKEYDSNFSILESDSVHLGIKSFLSSQFNRFEEISFQYKLKKIHEIVVEYYKHRYAIYLQSLDKYLYENYKPNSCQELLSLLDKPNFEILFYSKLLYREHNNPYINNEKKRDMKERMLLSKILSDNTEFIVRSYFEKYNLDAYDGPFNLKIKNDVIILSYKDIQLDSIVFEDTCSIFQLLKLLMYHPEEFIKRYGELVDGNLVYNYRKYLKTNKDIGNWYAIHLGILKC